MSRGKKSTGFPFGNLQPRNQAEALAQGYGKPSAALEQVKAAWRGVDEARGRLPTINDAALPTHKARKRKQQGRTETQPEREVLAMILSVWPGAEVEQQHKMMLAERTDYTIDFRHKADGQDIRTEAKGAVTQDDSSVKFKVASKIIRWAFFIWAKKHEDGHWTFEVWHAGERLKFPARSVAERTKRPQNPKSMAECRELIEATTGEREAAL